MLQKFVDLCLLYLKHSLSLILFLLLRPHLLKLALRKINDKGLVCFMSGESQVHACITQSGPLLAHTYVISVYLSTQGQNL